MKAIISATNVQLKRVAYGVSALAVSATIVGSTGTAAAHDSKDHKKNQASVQNNKNQRNTKNYNYTYNINYNFYDRDNKSHKQPRNDNKSKTGGKTAKSHHSEKNAKFASTHSHTKKQNRVYTETKWVYDPRLCRWVEIGHNKSTDRWELTYENDRVGSRRNNPSDDKNFSYWYNN